MHKARVSLKLRLALYCAALAGTMVAAVMGLSYWQFSSALSARVHVELFGEHRLILKDFSRAPDIDSIVRAMQALDGSRLDHPGLNVAVLPITGGQPIATRGDEGKELATLASGRNWDGVREFDRENYLLAAVMSPVTARDGKVYRVATGMDRTADRDLLDTRRRQLLVGWFGFIVLIGLLAGAIASRSLRPLHQFSAQIESVTARHLGRRIDGDDVPAELRQLSDAFNHLLANLNDSFSRLNAFSSDIAHELRGPLANLVGITHVALTQARSADAYRQALELNAEELERLTFMVEDMLFLARSENASATLNRESIELRGLCQSVADYYEIGALERNIHIEVSGRGQVRADGNLLRRAIGNLLSNAIKYASAPSVIFLSIEAQADGQTAIRVVNTGMGIAPDLLPRLFDRFWRADSSRHRTGTADGTGLGLAIVRSIMMLHGGEVTYDSTDDGRVVFTLRLSSRDDEPPVLPPPAAFSGHALQNV